MKSRITFHDGRPHLLRNGDPEDLRIRCEWINAAQGTCVVGPAMFKDGMLLRPFITGRPLDRLGPSERTQALGKTAEAISELHGRGLVHLGLTAHSIIGGGNAFYLLESGLSRPLSSDEDKKTDLLALDQLSEEYGSRESDFNVRSSVIRSSRHMMAFGGITVILLIMFLYLAGPEQAFTGVPASTAETSIPATSIEATPPRVLYAPTSTTVLRCDPGSCSEIVHWEDGIFTVDGNKYRLGSAGDQFFYGHWDCATVASPALLTKSGSLYVFTDWDLPAVRTEIGPGSRVEIVSQGQCDGLVVTSPDGESVRFPSSS